MRDSTCREGWGGEVEMMTQLGLPGSSTEIPEGSTAVTILFRAIYTALYCVLCITSSLKCPMLPAKRCFFYIDGNSVYSPEEDGNQ